MFKRVQHDKYQKFKAKMDRVWTMDGLEFEEFTCDILKENGFKDVKKTQACGDYGVDVIACKNNKKYAIQCKRYKSSLGIAAIQQVYTGKDYYKADIAVVLTTSSFTRNAKNTAAKLNVQLWERTELQKLMKNALNSISEKYKKEQHMRNAEEKRRQQRDNQQYNENTDCNYDAYQNTNNYKYQEEQNREQRRIAKTGRKFARKEKIYEYERRQQEKQLDKEFKREQKRIVKAEEKRIREEKNREYERQEQINKNKIKYAAEVKKQEIDAQRHVKKQYYRERRKRFYGKVKSFNYLEILKKTLNILHNIFFWIMSVVLLICAIYEITAERNVKLIITYFWHYNQSEICCYHKQKFISDKKMGDMDYFFIWYVVWWNLCNIKTVHISSIIIDMPPVK